MAPGAVAQVADELDRLGIRRPMLVTGQRTLRSSAGRQVYEFVQARGGAAFSQVPQHSGVAVVRAGVAFALDRRFDGMVALGGGSASDTAKAIAIVLAEGGDIADHANVFHPPDRYVQKALDKPKLPLIAIPTTASAAEVTPGLGIRAEDGHKLVFWDPNVVPRSIILDPIANLEVPVEIMATTAMNAFAHCVEGLYSRVRNPISDALALHAAGRLGHGIPTMVASPEDVGARTQVLVGAHLSGHVIANARVGLHHAICHGLGSHGGLSHGVANSILLPHVLRYNRPAVRTELAALAAALGETVLGLGESEAAERGLAAVEKLQARARVPRRLRDVGFDRALIPAIAAMTLSDRGAYFNPIPAAPKEDIEGVLEAAW